MENSIEGTEKREKDYEREIRRLEEKKNDLNQKIQDLNEDVAETEQQREAYKNSRDRVTKQLEDAKRKIRQLEGENFQMENKITDLRDDEERFRKEKNRLNDGKQSMEIIAKRLEGELDNEKKGMNDIKSSNRDLTSRITNMETVIKDLRKQAEKPKMDEDFQRQLLKIAG